MIHAGTNEKKLHIGSFFSDYVQWMKPSEGVIRYRPAT